MRLQFSDEASLPFCFEGSKHGDWKHQHCEVRVLTTVPGSNRQFLDVTIIPRRHLTNEKHNETLVAITHPCEDYERCESMELDDKIRDLIAGTPEATSSLRNGHSPQTLRKSAGSSSRDMAARSGSGAYTEHAQCAPSRRKDLTSSLEQKIRHLEKQRQELLEVNQQWDQQFRNMKELYERKVLELKTKLAATEDIHILEKKQKQTEGYRQLEKEKESLREELQALKRENKLLKENNALESRKKEHYACEIKRLNKALQDALAIGSSSLSEGSRKCKGRCSHAEMRPKVESHKQQPEYQWNVLNQLPPHVQHKAHGFSSERKFNQ
ncbi:TNFAIP3-interacting protein 3 [Peromyscus californicus insignis]|uniref:TNFAIP3-interacting protein 3 n=1 Tax=Peromyscus californicus insignis TaxID=564181 RepID=UPI0022A682E3|nr:TNFAIP3-interacting protein 3 [Peromyscus californicus insignis]